MTMNPLPPQAYTKDTLVLAYAWLQSQNESIKEIATSPDILVSLYLKAKLQGEGALERPSIKNFKSELKSLAGMMGEFEVMDSEKPSNVRVRANANGISNHAHSGSHSNTHSNSHSSPHSGAYSQVNHHTESKLEHHHVSKNDFQSMDLQSLTMIQEVKTKLNLSSEQEALRLLLSVGYNHTKALFK